MQAFCAEKLGWEHAPAIWGEGPIDTIPTGESKLQDLSKVGDVISCVMAENQLGPRTLAPQLAELQGSLYGVQIDQ